MRKLMLCFLVTIGLFTSCSEIESTSGDKPSVTSNQTEQAPEPSKEAPKDITLKAGNYVVGTDIPVGVYDISHYYIFV